MTKRPCDSEEFTRQMKKVVTDAMVNENDPTLMNIIYEKTNEALYNGSKKAFDCNLVGFLPRPWEGPLDSDDVDVEMEEYFKEEAMDIALRNNHGDLKKSPEEIMEQAAAQFGFLDKSEVNRFIRLQRRSPSPFPREAIRNKCSCCYNNIESSRQLCLRNMWAVSDNGNSSSGSFHAPVHHYHSELQKDKKSNS